MPREASGRRVAGCHSFQVTIEDYSQIIKNVFNNTLYFLYLLNLKTGRLYIRMKALIC